MHIRNQLLTFAASATVLFSATAASASTDPRGVWIDHTGRGAVEITDCNDALCGRVVWVKDADSSEACGVQILGDVKPVGAGVWDKGWIYDPEEDEKYSVELKPISAEKLRVLGYLGTKLFSETMIWQRAPADLQRCAKKETMAALDPKAEEGASAPPAVANDKSKLPVDEPAASDQAAATPESSAVPAPPAETPSSAGQDRPQVNSDKPKECKVQTPWLSFSFPCPE